jgi:enediyne biosynthesis protein E4
MRLFYSMLLITAVMALGVGTATAGAVFTESAAAAGVSDTGAAQGPTWGDYDNDGDEDLLLCVDSTGSARLFNNNGSGVFTEVTNPFPDLVESNSASWFDYDNDGDLDIFFGAVYMPSEFYVNNGDGTFTNDSGLFSATDSDFENIFGQVVGDYTGDGYTDIFIAPFSTSFGANGLWRNNQGADFTDIAAPPLSDTLVSPRAANSIDYDNDGDLDIYLNHTGGSSVLFRNEGNGVFTDATGGDPLGNFSRLGRGSTWADLDTDGDLDLVLSNSTGDNVIARNDGGGVFTEVTGTDFNSGVIDEAICPIVFDYDNNGNLDIFVHTLIFGGGDRGAIFQGDGALGFTDVTATVAPSLLTDLADGRGASVADVDDDGDLDLYRANGTDAEASFFYVNGTNNSDWLKVKLVGTFSDPQAFGTQVSVYEAGTTNLVGYSQVQSQVGYEGFNSLIQHFGVPAAGNYDVVALFPRLGLIASAEAVATAQTIVLTEPAPAFTGAEHWETYH